jgi:thymidylate synthase
MKRYIDIINRIFSKGEWKSNRTGIDTLAIPGAMFEHDMSTGFPLVTTKFVPFRLVASELEFFIKGLTDKEWLKARDNHIWDEWCNPNIVPYGHDDETRKKMMEERDLGPIYGFQWRNFGALYTAYNLPPATEGVDQLKLVVEKLKTDPHDRRMIVSAWSPVQIKDMALPPCHYSYQVIVINNKLSLIWNQRSIDVALGLPFNIASYGLLLHLLAKDAGFQEGSLIGFLGDTHIYRNHVDGLKKQIARDPYKLPTISTDNFESIFDWSYENTSIIDYKHHKRISFKIAV